MTTIRTLETRIIGKLRGREHHLQLFRVLQHFVHPHCCQVEYTMEHHLPHRSNRKTKGIIGKTPHQKTVKAWKTKAKNKQRTEGLPLQRRQGIPATGEARN